MSPVVRPREAATLAGSVKVNGFNSELFPFDNCPSTIFAGSVNVNGLNSELSPPPLPPPVMLVSPLPTTVMVVGSMTIVS